MQLMWRLDVPVVAVVIGEGSSGGALGLGIADRVLMLENSTYSVISPEGASAILWRDASQAKRAAQAFKPTAANCYRWGVADAVIPEPPGGAHTDHEQAAEILGQYLQRTLLELEAQTPAERRVVRRERFRRLGPLRDPEGGVAMASGRDAPPPG
jgi:acetyl-CoA carboxylase alpha subunit